MTTRAVPDLAARWLRHALPDGRPPDRARLTMAGHIRVGRWLPFTAHQEIDATRGFTWTARAGRVPLTISGSDRWVDGAGRQDWRLWGAVPVLRAAGSDVTRSAVWRWAAESLVWLPGRWDAVAWLPDRRAGCVTAVVTAGGERMTLTVAIAEDGRLLSLGGPRWGNPLGRPWGYHPFGVTVLAERTFDGVTVPSRISAGWGWGTDWAGRGEFFRATLTSVAWTR